MPSLRANINEKAWATQRKALYSRMSQAISMMPSLNGYGIVMNSDGTVNETETAKKATQTFISEGLSKVLKINNICDSSNIKKCGISSKFRVADGTKTNFPNTMYKLHPSLGSNYTLTGAYALNGAVSLIDTNTAAFETANGESVVVFYQPLCKYSTNEIGAFAPYLCANFIVDLNGKKGPNAIGKDISFISVFYPTDSLVVAPEPLTKDSASGKRTPQALTVCRNLGPEYRLPNREEMAAIAINGGLFTLKPNHYITATKNTNYTAIDNMQWKVINAYLYWTTLDYETGLAVRCIKRSKK